MESYLTLKLKNQGIQWCNYRKNRFKTFRVMETQIYNITHKKIQIVSYFGTYLILGNSPLLTRDPNLAYVKAKKIMESIGLITIKIVLVVLETRGKNIGVQRSTYKISN